MLLRHTTDEEYKREALTINPAKTCQPIGAMYAALGIHNCLPHSHGSQGCCSYHRSTLTRHLKQPVMAATSSFSEGSSVFGGQSNLVQAIDVIFTVYNPDVIAVHTTCLSETIGDDMLAIISAADEAGKIPEGKKVFYTNTPSYQGTHITGYSNQLCSFIKFFAESTGKKTNMLNVAAGWMEPSEYREIKRMLNVMGVPNIMYPDMSDVLDLPNDGKYKMFPKGGTTLEQLAKLGDSKATIGLGKFATKESCIKLEQKCDVPFEIVDIPIGLKATDRFLMQVSDLTGRIIPEELADERGRLVDLITSNSKYFYKKRVAVWGDPDTIIPLCEFLVSLDMYPTWVVTGTYTVGNELSGTEVEQRLGEILKDVPDAKFMAGERADMFQMHSWIKQDKNKGIDCDLMMGNTYGKWMARDENCDFVRIGFPIADRPGHNYLPKVGYNGAAEIVRMMLTQILDRFDRECPETKIEFML